MNRGAIAVAPAWRGSRESAARPVGGIFVACCLALAGLAAAETAPLGEDDPVMAAMRDEMTRSLQELKLDGAEGPYFIAYRVFDVVSERANASLGSLLNRGTGASRQLVVELRVGSHDFDNTNYVASSPSRTVRAALPLGDDYDAMRRQIWLATDRAYKQAVNDLSGKRAALQNRTRVEEIPDFSREPPHRHDGRASGKFEPGRSEAMVLAVSGAFRGMPELRMSEVRANAQQSRTYFVDSEGSAFITDRHSVQVEALAGVQAADGVELQDFLTAYGNSLGRHPRGRGARRPSEADGQSALAAARGAVPRPLHGAGAVRRTSGGGTHQPSAGTETRGPQDAAGGEPAHEEHDDLGARQSLSGPPERPGAAPLPRRGQRPDGAAGR